MPAAFWTVPCTVCVTPLPAEETVDAVVVEVDDPAAVLGAGAFTGAPVAFEALVVVPPEVGTEAAGAVPALEPPWAGRTEATWHAMPPTVWATSDPEPDEQAGVVPD